MRAFVCLSARIYVMSVYVCVCVCVVCPCVCVVGALAAPLPQPEEPEISPFVDLNEALEGKHDWSAVH